MQNTEKIGNQGPGQDHTQTRIARLRTIIRYDLPSSLVVFLVALPLSLGIAIASNAPVLAGLIAAIVGGIIVGAIGGSPLQGSGPAPRPPRVGADFIFQL